MQHFLRDPSYVRPVHLYSFDVRGKNNQVHHSVKEIVPEWQQAIIKIYDLRLSLIYLFFLQEKVGQSHTYHLNDTDFHKFHLSLQHAVQMVVH